MNARPSPWPVRLSLMALLAAGCSAPGQPHPSGGGTANQPADTFQTARSGAQVPAHPASDSAPPIAPPAAPPAATSSTPVPAGASDSGYVSYDPATKTVTFRLVAGPFAFNGYTSGGATLTVPPGTTNVMNFEQADGTPHSAEIAPGTGPIPNSGGDPAIPRAYTNKVVEGMVQGAKDVMRFTAPDSGTYRIICGVPGHALSGMWIWYKVDPAAKTPTFGPTPK
jgi:plastocyanin